MQISKVLSRVLPLAAAIMFAPLATAQSDQVCPRPPSTDGTKIVGGFAAKAAEWPGITSLQVELRDKTGVHICGATAISSRWLLTAAHCVETTEIKNGTAIFSEWNSERTALRPRGILRAVIGVGDLAAAKPEQIYKIEKIVSHPDYIEGAAPFGNDIALIKLSKNYTGPKIGLSLTSQTDALTLMGEIAEVAGFGDLTFNQSGTADDRAILPDGSGIYASSAELMQTTLATTPNTICTRKIEKIMEKLPDYAHPFELTSAQICAGRRDTDSCQGDSGGPLIKVNKNGCPYQIGVVSWGVKCAVEDTPSVYTRVSQYADWIAQTTGVESGQKQSDLPPEQTGALDLFKRIESQFPGTFATIPVEILNTANQPVSVIEPEQFINLKLKLPIRGKLIIFDYNADKELRQLYPNKDEGAIEQAWPALDAGRTVLVPKDLFRFRFQAGTPYGRQAILAMIVPEANTLPVDMPTDVTEAVSSPLGYILSLMRSTLLSSNAKGIHRIEIGDEDDAAPQASAASAPETPAFALGFVEYCIDSSICGEAP